MRTTDAASAPRFIAGDPLRAIAALGVVVFHLIFALGLLHFPADPGAAHALARFSELPRLGLYVFFVLSGYLLGRPFVRAFVERRAAPDIAGYLRNRALRIAPGFWLAVTLTIVVFGTSGASGRQIAALYLFAQDADPSSLSAHLLQGWTIGLELCFYFLLPVAALLLGAARAGLRRRQRLIALWSLLMLAAAASLVFQSAMPAEVDGHGWQRSLPAMLFAFLPGIALAAAELDLVDWLARRPRRGAAVARGLLAVGAVAAGANVAVVPNGAEWIGSATAALAAGAVVGAALVRQWARGDAPSALDNRPMRWMGERSYGIYLLHSLPIGFVFARVGGASAAVAGVTIVGATLLVTPLLAALSYRFVEQPFLRLRRGWRRGAGTAPAVRPRPPSVPVRPPLVAPLLAARDARDSTASPVSTTPHSPH